MTSLIAAVIPYFQREEGILRRSVLSALRQREVEPFPIVVVDDGSPVPAHRELADLMSQHPDRIKVLEQPNAGPGAARNAALDALYGATQFVAFLDSDDEWSDVHLSNALHALHVGFDFYFSDYRNEWAEATAFQTYGFNISTHRVVDGHRSLYEYSGDFFDAMLGKPSFFLTSAVVYRFQNFSEVRFDTRFRRAYDDVLFWLTLAHRTRKVSFSGSCEFIRGKGINIYHSSGWASESAFDTLHDEMTFYRYLMCNFPLTESQTARIRAKIRQTRRSIARTLLHRMWHGKRIGRRTLVECTLKEPDVLAYAVSVCYSVLLDRLRRQLSRWRTDGG